MVHLLDSCTVGRWWGTVLVPRGHLLKIIHSRNNLRRTFLLMISLPFYLWSISPPQDMWLDSPLSHRFCKSVKSVNIKSGLGGRSSKQHSIYSELCSKDHHILRARHATRDHILETWSHTPQRIIFVWATDPRKSDFLPIYFSAENYESILVIIVIIFNIITWVSEEWWVHQDQGQHGSSWGRETLKATFLESTVELSLESWNIFIFLHF